MPGYYVIHSLLSLLPFSFSKRGLAPLYSPSTFVFIKKAKAVNLGVTVGPARMWAQTEPVTAIGRLLWQLASNGEQ